MTYTKPPDESPGVFVLTIRSVIPRERSDRGNPYPLQVCIKENGSPHRLSGLVRSDGQSRMMFYRIKVNIIVKLWTIRGNCDRSFPHYPQGSPQVKQGKLPIKP